MRRGYALIIDSLVALTFALILLTSMIGLRQGSSSYSEVASRRLHYVSEDAFEVLDKKGVLDRVGEEWAAADGNVSSPHWANASNTSSYYLDLLLPSNVGYMLTIDDDMIVNNTRVPYDSSSALTHSTRLLVGYGAGLPSRGEVARAFLSNIEEKETSSYTYFGGFVGNGNITVKVRDIPSDADIKHVCLELNTPSGFVLYVNGVQVAPDFTATSGGSDAALKDYSVTGFCPGLVGASGCVASSYFGDVVPGVDNEFTLMFTDPSVSKQYVGGGYINVVYSTHQMDTDRGVQTSRYYLPQVNGIINVRDSFYVPGLLSSMVMNLTYRSNYSVELKIGDRVVHTSVGNASWQRVYIDEAAMASKGLIYQPVGDPKSLSENTVPISFWTDISGIGGSNYSLESANVTSAYVASMLNESYIEFTYTPLNRTFYGEVSLKRFTCAFDDAVTCQGVLPAPPGIVVSDAKVLSYSGRLWTSRLTASNSLGATTVYSLPGWSAAYGSLGDPFAVNVPADYIPSGENTTLTVLTANGSSDTGCSADDKAVYTLRMRTTVGYGDVFLNNDGCNWTIEFEDGSSFSASLPGSYNGTDTCFYTSSSLSYGDDDAAKDAVYRLLSQLDPDSDRRVDLLFDTDMVDFELGQASGVQSLWGPATFKLVVWM